MTGRSTAPDARPDDFKVFFKNKNGRNNTVVSSVYFCVLLLIRLGRPDDLYQ